MTTSPGLMIGGLSAQELAERFQTPLYAYDLERIAVQLQAVRRHLPDFAVYYSLKANPNKGIANFLKEQGCGFEIASAGELYLSRMLGMPPGRIVFAGPGKTDEELEYAVREGIQAVNVESARELERLEAIARRMDTPVQAQIRVNTTTGVSDAPEMMVGRPSKFGIEQEDLPAVIASIPLQYVTIIGVHLYTASGVLQSEEIIANFERACQVLLQLQELCGRKMTLLDFGGGFGVPYNPEEKPLDIRTVGEGIQTVLRQNFGSPAGRQFVIELGRYLVAESGVYLTRVLDVKQSRGKTFVIVEGGMNHFIRPVFMGQNHPTVVANKLGQEAAGLASVGGQLCTPIDMLANDVPLPAVEVGDLIAVQHAGAYGYSMSMLEFLSHPRPAEAAVQGDRAWLIRQRGKYQELFDYR